VIWFTPFSTTELEGKLAGGAQSSRLHRLLKGPTGSVLSAAFSSDGKRVVTASSDKTARIWDADSGQEIAQLKGHTGPVLSASFSPDGKRVVTVCSAAPPASGTLPGRRSSAATPCASASLQFCD
jgi:WD40 repeat protein